MCVRAGCLEATSTLLLLRRDPVTSTLAQEVNLVCSFVRDAPWRVLRRDW